MPIEVEKEVEKPGLQSDLEAKKAINNAKLDAIPKQGKRSYKLPKEIEEKLHPWDRQKGESHTQFKSFLLWRDTPSVDRNLKELGKMLGHANSTTVSRWSKQWDWDGRARAYDNHLQNLELNNRESRIVDMNERHINIAYAAQVQLAKAIEALDPKRLSPKDIMEWFKISVEIERRAFEVDGAGTNVTITQNNFKEIIHKATDTDEEANRLTNIIDTLKDVGAFDDYERPETATRGPKAIEAEYKIIAEKGEGTKPA
jgi:hypothetical protein